eukprot:589349-Prymnesium_polylepis.2
MCAPGGSAVRGWPRRPCLHGCAPARSRALHNRAHPSQEPSLAMTDQTPNTANRHKMPLAARHAISGRSHRRKTPCRCPKKTATSQTCRRQTRRPRGTCS